LIFWVTEHVPVGSMQAASLHWSASELQLTGMPAVQTPTWQRSMPLQARESSHEVPFGRVAVWQPLEGLHESVVQGLPSLQIGGGPPWQVPAPQASLVVQALLSLHGPVLSTWVQPEPGLQASVVQTLPSSQPSGGPPAQLPPLQASPVVQALPSVHGALLFRWVQPRLGEQLSSVQTLLSLQLGAVPA
jgi:hypothetical protein